MKSLFVEYTYPDGGYSSEHLSKIPTVGDSITLHGVTYKVAKIAPRRRVDKTSITVYLEFTNIYQPASGV